MTAGRHLGVFARGMGMGIAEVVPGVSGGTIAFISGIYDELVTGIARFGPASLVQLVRAPREFWISHNMNFFMALLLGMMLAVLMFAHVLSLALDAAPSVVWGFFFGLIAASVLLIGRQASVGWLATLGTLGIACGFATTLMAPMGLEPGLLVFFGGGAIAVCAWILPAVSGSFLLLVLGIYEHVLAAVAAFDVTVLAVFVAGCVTGLMLFSRALSWVITHYRVPMLAFLTGFMAGAAVKLWPWRVGNDLLMPAQYETVVGQSAYPLPTVLAVLAGIFVVWMLSRVEP